MAFRLDRIDEDARNFSLAQSEKDKRIIAEKIQLILEDPFRQYTRQLEGIEWVRDFGSPVRRFRAGDFRILYCVDRDTGTVAIVDIKLRTGSTYGYGKH